MKFQYHINHWSSCMGWNTSIIESNDPDLYAVVGNFRDNHPEFTRVELSFRNPINS